MIADTRDPQKVLKKLYAELLSRRPVIDRAHDYYDGAHPLAFASEKFREAFGGLFDAFADNWCGVVVDAVDERLAVQGFRVGEQPSADKDAKRLWEGADLDLQAGMGHVDGLIGGAFFVTVWQGDGDKVPEITVDSARTTVVECHPKIRRRRTAALRTWVDDDGFEHAELFRPEGVYLFRSKSKRTNGVPSGGGSWMVEDLIDSASELDANGMMPNPLGVVPVVEFLNRPRLTISRKAGWGAHSELAAVLPVQDAVNKFVADLLIGSEFAAYPQRYLTGYEPADEIGADGKPTGRIVEPKFRSGPGNVWWLEDTEARFGQFDAADLGGLVKAVDTMVQHIASISATPPHYLSASADRLSGESIRSAESGLVAKVYRKQRAWGAGWEEVMRLAGQVAELQHLANAQQMETIWKDPETRTESEHVDAVLKKKDLDVPAPQLWEELGYTPEQMGRFPALRAQMQLEGMAANAAEQARLATAEADRLRAASVQATGGLPPTPLAAP